MAENPDTPNEPDVPPNGDEELTAESLQKKLQEYHAAIASEFEASVAADDSDDNIKQQAEDFWKKNFAAAAAQIAWLSQNSTSDAVRASTSKFICDMALKQEKESNDPIKDLLESLKGKTSTKKVPASKINEGTK